MTTVIRKLPQAFVGVFLKAGKETRSFKDVMNCLFLYIKVDKRKRNERMELYTVGKIVNTHGILPVIDDVVKEVDLAGGKVIVELLEGLE